MLTEKLFFFQSKHLRKHIVRENVQKRFISYHEQRSFFSGRRMNGRFYTKDALSVLRNSCKHFLVRLGMRF